MVSNLHYSRRLSSTELETLGDLGIWAKDVENTLETNFALANRWGCILLLDEADVFLASRTPTDHLRNSMVSGEDAGFPV